MAFMANKINFQKELDKLLEQNQREARVPSLFLHSCCAPCSSYVIEYLSDYFQITVFYYNPNIYPDEEYLHRVKEQQHLICQIPQKYPVSFLEGDFDKERFYDMAKGLVFSAIGSVWKKRHSLQRNMDLTISARHSRSVL